MLRSHLDASGLSQRELAHQIGYSEAQVSSWLRASDRMVGQETIGRIAYALAGRYASNAAARKNAGEQASGPFLGPEDLVTLVFELLDAAGYRVGDNYGDRVWRRLFGQPYEKRRLKIGWYEKWPLIYRDAQGALTGPIKALTDRICASLTVRPEWTRVSVPLHEITSKLRSGEIDMVCGEFIGARSIQFDVWLSREIPGVRVAPTILAHSKYLPDLVTPHNTLRFDKAHFVHSQTVIGHGLLSASIPSSILFPHDSIEEDDDVSSPIPGSLQDCYEIVLRDPIVRNSHGEERVRCLVTDTLTLLEAKRTHGNVVAELPVPEPMLPDLGLCFALHPEESARLGTVIDQAILDQDRMGFVQKCLAMNEAWRLAFRENELLVNRILGRVVSAAGWFES